MHLFEKKGIQLVIHPVEVRDLTLGGPSLFELVDHYADYAVQQAMNAFPEPPSPVS